MEKTKEKKVVVIILIVLLGICIGVSYAYWQLVLRQNSENKVASSCISIELIDESNAIKMEEAYPLDVYKRQELHKAIENNEYIILNRYIPSSMAHQGGKIQNKEARKKFYQEIEYLEYEILSLPKPNIIFFLYVPIEVSCKLLEQRGNADKAETNIQYLQNAMQAYQELAKLYKYCIIDCTSKKKLRDIDDIHEEIYQKLFERI